MNRQIISIVLTVFFIISVLFSGYLIYEHKITHDEMPRIICEYENIEASVNTTDEELLKGVTAIDKEDGDITSSLVVESISKFVEKAKDLGVTFVFFGEKEADIPLGCGYIVEALDHVLITFLSLAAFIASMRVKSFSSTKGPFFRLLLILCCLLIYRFCVLR